jgi:protein TonB
VNAEVPDTALLRIVPLPDKNKDGANASRNGVNSSSDRELRGDHSSLSPEGGTVFEDSLFATNARREPRRGWTAVLSFGVQAVLLGVLVLVPLLYTDALPLGSLRNYVEIPPPPGRQAPPQQQQHQAASRPRSSNMENNHLVEPRQIPPNITRFVDPVDVSAPGGNDNGVVGMPPGIGRSSTALNPILNGVASSVLGPPVSHPNTIRLGGNIVEGLLIHRITPPYPKIAVVTHTQGSVVLQALIGRDGSIQNLHVVSGHPLLIKAAVDAVKQWRYRPYLLNNEPVEVETQITVNFTLGG